MSQTFKCQYKHPLCKQIIILTQERGLRTFVARFVVYKSADNLIN